MSGEVEGRDGAGVRAARGGGWRWIAAVVGLIGVNVGICTVTVVAARRSQPPIEANYDAKALRWDDSSAQRAANRSLGWHVQAGAERGGDGRVMLNVRVLDSSGRGIRIARVVATINADGAKERQELEMQSDDAGRYSAEMARSARGWWDVQIAAEAGGVKFCDVTRVYVSGRESGLASGVGR